MDSRALISSIEEAWKEVEPPKHIADDLVFEGGDTQRDYADEDWRTLNFEKSAIAWGDVFIWGTPEAIRYFMPAYLITCIQQLDDDWPVDPACGAVLSYLTGRSAKPSELGLSDPQRRCVVQVLEKGLAQHEQCGLDRKRFERAIATKWSTPSR